MNKVFGIGLSRTGTMSLTRALQLLRYRALHFPSDDITQSEIYRFLASRSEFISLSVLKDFDAITDTPVCCTYQALDRSYPGSKFILTVREKKSWLSSCRRFWEEELEYNFRKQPDSSVNRYIRLLHDRLYGTQKYEPEAFSRAYGVYVAGVSEYFKDRSQDFLILDICGGEGWDKLAPLLGATIPKVPFPFENRLPKKYIHE